MFFNKKKKEESKPTPTTTDILKRTYVEKCNQNTKQIISKIAIKREELYHKNMVTPDKKEEVDKGIKNIVLYMQRINWESIVSEALKNSRLQDIDENFTNLIDPETSKYLINLTWQSVKDDVNRMIMDVINLIEAKEEK